MFTLQEIKRILASYGAKKVFHLKKILKLLAYQNEQTEKQCALMAISPIDGRYAEKTRSLKEIFSEFGLIKFRVMVEVRWLEFLLRETKLATYSDKEMKIIKSVLDEFNIESAMRIKEIEKVSNHDVNAVIEYIKEQLDEKGLGRFSEYVHLFLTSEDVNNVSYSMMLNQAEKIIRNKFENFCELIAQKVKAWKEVVMIGHTHGQPATPTTMGKEFLVFYKRFQTEIFKAQSWKAQAKWSGATGTFAAHYFAMPEINWIEKSKHFVDGYLHMEYIPVSTQINPHHDIAELLQIIIRIAGIIVDMSSDMWLYTSMDYLKQRPKAGEVGSSTMPHKVNPIDWENARGNAKVAIALCECLSRELLVSTMQRDLSDSTLQRNLGTLFSHMLIAVESCIKAMGKIDINLMKINKDLKDNPEVITEAIQVLLRVLGISDAYDRLKELSRGKKLNKKILREFVDGLDINKKYKGKILGLTPAKYLGLCLEIISNEIS
ncbi:MAG: adenylosuccinate lyase [Patescibacteria group bacterium]|nr:adenylosuccinate lyase [Patescibacteria group bacterium]